MECDTIMESVVQLNVMANKHYLASFPPYITFNSKVFKSFYNFWGISGHNPAKNKPVLAGGSGLYTSDLDSHQRIIVDSN